MKSIVQSNKPVVSENNPIAVASSVLCGESRSAKNQSARTAVETSNASVVGPLTVGSLFPVYLGPNQSSSNSNHRWYNCSLPTFWHFQSSFNSYSDCRDSAHSDVEWVEIQ